MKLWQLIIWFSILILVSCKQEEPNKDKHKKLSKQLIKESMIKTNQHLLKSEDRSIRDFIARYQYNMKETGSGLFYEIYKKGRGAQSHKGDVAEINFSVRLLNGQMVYRSDEEGIKEFEIGKGGVESGLEEGILLLHVGDHARFIIPSHLAFGLLGDLDKIPEKATLVYDIELINLKI